MPILVKAVPFNYDHRIRLTRANYIGQWTGNLQTNDSAVFLRSSLATFVVRLDLRGVGRDRMA